MHTASPHLTSTGHAHARTHPHLQHPHAHTHTYNTHTHPPTPIRTHPHPHPHPSIPTSIHTQIHLSTHPRTRTCTRASPFRPQLHQLEAGDRPILDNASADGELAHSLLPAGLRTPEQQPPGPSMHAGPRGERGALDGAVHPHTGVRFTRGRGLAGLQTDHLLVAWCALQGAQCRGLWPWACL